MATPTSNTDHLILFDGRNLPTIFSTAAKIVHKVDQVKINKRQCQTLIDRIQIVISYLQKPSLIKRLQVNNNPLNQTLENFQRFLEDCYNFISSFADRSAIRQFISSSVYKEEFTRLNNQLQTYYSELTLGMNIQNFINQKQDEHDHNEDQNQLLTTITEQLKILTDQQNNCFEQLTKLDKILTRNNVQPQLQIEYLQSASDNDIFKNGIWSNRCYEYNKWHGPFQHQILFNLNDNTCNGHGEDHVDSFILTGTFPRELQQINIVLSYQTDSKLEIAHQCQFQLQWNDKLNLFDGLKYKPVGWDIFFGGLFEMSFLQAVQN